MKKLTIYVFSAVGLMVLAVTGSIMSSRHAVAQGGPGAAPVTVVNTPLPISGNINVANAPTVGLASGASVLVGNTVGNPVPVRSVNDAIQPVSASGTCDASPPFDGCTATLFTGPQGSV